jgi:hypothetical protein
VGPRAGRRDLAGLVVLGAGLLLLMAWPYLVDGHRFGVGPDVPVYLWWTRVGASEGLSLLGSRPGAPALAAALAGTLNLNAAAVTAALPAALGVGAGTAAVAVVRSAGGRTSAAWLAGLLTGTFSVHLVAGYLANLVFAVTFLGAAACLAGPRRAWGVAALSLAGGGLAHPDFLVHGLVILAAAAALAWRDGARDEARDVVLAAGVGGLVAGAGVLATLAGPGPLAIETSKDGFLRRAGLDDTLIQAYRDRFRLRAARYVQWLSIPLALVGTARTGGFLRRFLIAWLVVMAVGVPLAWLTGWFPPDRLVTFGFAVPVAAAIGLTWVQARLGARPWLAWTVVLLAVGWIVGGAALAWLRQQPFVSIREAARSEQLMGYAAAISEPGTPIVVIVDEGDATSTFLVARAANILRAAAPPDRAADVHVFLGTVRDYFAGRPTDREGHQFRAISSATLAAVPDGERVVVVLAEFYRGDDVREDPHLQRSGDGAWVAPSVPMRSSASDMPTRLSWRPASAPIVGLATVGILLALTILGLGYTFATFADRTTAIAAAPAFGAAALSLAAVALDALGLRLYDLRVALGATALAGLGGVAALVAERRVGAQASP